MFLWKGWVSALRQPELAPFLPNSTFMWAFGCDYRYLNDRQKNLVPLGPIALLGITFVLAQFLVMRAPGLLAERRRRRGQCEKCGYDLHGLPEPRCPECGSPFDILAVAHNTRSWAAPLWCLAASIGAGFVTVLAVEISLGMLIIGTIACTATAAVSGGLLRRRDGWRRRLLLLSIALSTASMLLAALLVWKG